MWFKPKKDVDLRELQRKGLIKIPKKEIEKDRNGFVDLRNTQTENSKNKSQDLPQNSETNFFGFMDNPQISSEKIKSNSNDDLEWTRKFEEMENKIYKLEQRIELLERKAGVGDSSGYSWQ